MILVLRPGTSTTETAEVLAELEKTGCTGHVVQTASGPVVHVTHGPTRRARKLKSLEQVLEVVPTSGPRVRREGWRFFPYHFVNWSAFGVALLGVLVFLAGMLPTGIGAEVDYSHPPVEVAQPWYLRPALAFVRLLPSAQLGWVLLALLALGFLFLPVLDRSRLASQAGRWARLTAALLALLAVMLCLWKGAEA